MPDQYLTVNDFLAYDKQLMGKLGRIGDSVAAVATQVQHLDAAFTDYRTENDAFRIHVHRQLANIEQTINGRIDTLEQSISQGFALIFAHLGIHHP